MATNLPPDNGGPSVVALIPARSGSKRVPDKNIRLLNGHPLLAYTIAAAKQSGVFGQVIVTTDSDHYADIAFKYGGIYIMRPPSYAGDMSPDIEWVTHALNSLGPYECFSILRPTSPFRTADTIKRAWAEFCTDPYCDSLRAVEPAKQHPGKMWRVTPGKGRMMPYVDDWHRGGGTAQPYHSMPTQALPPVYAQNASLEIAWCRVVRAGGTISGVRVRPFFTEGYEGFDLNTELDWLIAEVLAYRGLAVLPDVSGLVEAR